MSADHTGNDADAISHGELKARRRFLEKAGHEFVVDGHVHEVNSKAVRKRVRRSHDARMLFALGESRVRAMQLLWSAYMMIAAPLQAAVFNPFRMSAGGADVERGKALQQMYWRWAQEVQRLKLDHSMCVDVAVDGHTPGAVDVMRRQCKGKAMNNLIECLDVSLRLGILNLDRDGDG